MKRILILAIAMMTVSLAACSNSKGKENQYEETYGYKPVDFLNIKENQIPRGEKIYVIGKVSGFVDVNKSEFTLATEEKDENGIIKIKVGTEMNMKEGDKAKIYGIYEGKDRSGVPILNGHIKLIKSVTGK